MIKFNDFFENKNVNKNFKTNPSVKDLFDYLKEPNNIYGYILSSQHNLPVITFIVKRLEKKFGEDLLFPLSNNYNKQVVGKMLSYILSFYGYTVKNTTSSEEKLRKFSQASLFKTSAVYEKTLEAKLEIKITSIDIH